MLELPPPIVSPAIIRPIGPRLLRPGYLPVSREARRVIVSELRRKGIITKEQAQKALMLVLPASSNAGGNDANTQLLIQPSGGDGVTAFSDESQNGFTVTRGGNAEVDTGVTLLGLQTVLFDGTGDSLQVADDAALRAGTGDFTIDFNLQLAATGTSQSLWAKGYASAGGTLLQINTSNQLTVYMGASLAITSSALSGSTKYHIALERYGTTLTLFVDGADDGNTTDSTNLNDSSTLYIGNASTETGTNGSMNEIRYSDIARYQASNFTPPTAAYF